MPIYKLKSRDPFHTLWKTCVLIDWKPDLLEKRFIGFLKYECGSEVFYSYVLFSNLKINTVHRYRAAFYDVQTHGSILISDMWCFLGVQNGRTVLMKIIKHRNQKAVDVLHEWRHGIVLDGSIQDKVTVFSIGFWSIGDCLTPLPSAWRLEMEVLSKILTSTLVGFVKNDRPPHPALCVREGQQFYTPNIPSLRVETVQKALSKAWERGSTRQR